MVCLETVQSGTSKYDRRLNKGLKLNALLRRTFDSECQEKV